LTPVVAAAATLALAPLRDRMRTLAIIFCGIMVLGMYQIIAQCDPWAPHFEVFTQPRQELIQKNINYVLCNFLNKVVPEDGKVLALWDNRFFFLKRTFQADSVYESPTGLARLRLAGDPAVFTRELIASHFTHVTLRKNRATNYLNNSWTFNLLDDRIYPASQLEKDRELMTRFVDEYLEPVFEQEGNVVFRIRSELVAGEDERATTR